MEPIENIKLHALPYLATLLGCSEQEALDKPLTWQTFKESQAAKDSQYLYPTIKYANFRKLHRWLMNQNEMGMGIYLTINASNGPCREQKDIKEIRAVWMDVDFKESQPGFNLTPSLLQDSATPPNMIVSSGGGLHAYWILPTPIEANPENIKKETKALKGIQSKFAEYGADPKVCEPARVLRVPGFMNQKPGREPKLARMIAYGFGSSLSIDELCEAFPYTESKRNWDIANINFKYDDSLFPLTKRYEMALEWLIEKATNTPAIWGEDGSGKCLSAAWVGPRFALEPKLAFQLLSDIYNPECEPPFLPKELAHKIEDAYASAIKLNLIGCGMSDYAAQRRVADMQVFQNIDDGA